MKVVSLVSLFHQKKIGPRCELLYGNEVVIDVEASNRWRVEQENGVVEFFEGKPRYGTGKDGWPKIAQVTVGVLKFGSAKADPLDVRGVG